MRKLSIERTLASLIGRVFVLVLFAVAARSQKVQILPADLHEYESYAGNYKLARDRVVSLGAFSEADNYLLFFDSKTRRTGILYPVSKTQFVTGAINEDHSVTMGDLKVKFMRNPAGVVTGLTWREGSDRLIRARKVSPHHNEEVVFQNGKITLHGTLTVPATAGPHPVVILLQEAGPRSRPFGMWPYIFARYGIAMLTFDKRGSGDSTGDWNIANFDDLAGDTLAAVSLLRSRSDIDANHIGLWGNSNSGWYVPLIADRAKNIAFVINRVGSSLSPMENVLYEIENQMRDQGFREDEIQNAVSLRRMLQNSIVSNAGWEEFKKTASAARLERWFNLSRVGRYLAAPLPPDAATLGNWRGPMDYDPIKFWAKVKCPVLAIYGELDKNTPTDRNVPPLVEALKKAGNKDYKIIVLPKVGHPFFEYPATANGYYWIYPPVERYPSHYVSGMMDWISKRVGVRSRN